MGLEEGFLENRVDLFSSVYAIKKGEQEFTFFCPKSTMNLTYLCYGGSKLL
ncbi:hypothetical protein [Gaetbulibacter saemankumensis]|uniref:hypothetical protein n=1 Tax=Gaetbulibacter saemankumensis TaxID=311208 RepID=UPI0003F4E493|nr:hypothetical protein [Gaetbulibacter saemankumensis]